MRKETVFRKIVIYSLVGFPIGVTLLMLNYASVYLIAGENVFKTEISQLQNIATLVLQLIIIGWAYYLFFILISVIANLNETRTKSDKFVIEHPYKTILIMIIIMIATALIFTLLDFKVFSESMSMMNIITFMIVFVACVLYVCIKSAIESDLIKKINQKLKERNN